MNLEPKRQKRLYLSKVSLQELRRRVAEGEFFDDASVRNLKGDRRKGARSLARILERRRNRDAAEIARMEALLERERFLWRNGLTHIAGVDEAGAGPLAGPIVAAAVILPCEAVVAGVDDSKKLDRETREEFEREIRARAVSIGVGICSVEEIDRINILQAGLLAMRRALDQLAPPPEHVFVDARTLHDLPWSQEAVVGGDGCIHAIACASVIAKVHRDRLMRELDVQYPGYGFASHKGYGTPEHLAALDRLGPCALHRRTFHWDGRQLTLFGPDGAVSAETTPGLETEMRSEAEAETGTASRVDAEEAAAFDAEAEAETASEVDAEEAAAFTSVRDSESSP